MLSIRCASASIPVDNWRTRRLRDPTLHFFVVWLLAPIFAIVGASLDCAAWDLSATLVGWLITFSLWSGFGIRSVVYQWKALPRSPRKRWPDLSRTTSVELRLLTGIGLVTLLSSVAALIVCGQIIIGIANEQRRAIRSDVEVDVLESSCASSPASGIRTLKLPLLPRGIKSARESGQTCIHLPQHRRA
jgi:hypothetical protein